MNETSKYIERECRYGRMRWLAHDTHVGKSLLAYGEYSESEVALFRKIVRGHSTVISAGANIGCHIIPLARMCRHVYTAEPNPLVADLCVYNCSLNKVENVTMAVGAFGAAKGTATIMSTRIDEDTNYGGVELVRGGNLEVPVMPIDEFGLDDVCLIHLDVEGSELAALQGALETIERCRPILYVETNRPQDNDALLAWINANGYQTMTHYAPAFNPNNFNGKTHNLFPNVASIMALCIPW